MICNSYRLNSSMTLVFWMNCDFRTTQNTIRLGRFYVAKQPLSNGNIGFFMKGHKMEDCDGPTTYIASSWKTVTEKVDSSVLTDPREYIHQGIDAMERLSVAVQTEQAQSAVLRNTVPERAVSKEVLDLLLSTVKSNNEEPNVLAPLNAFHHTDSVTLSVIRQFQLPQTEELPLHSVVCGPNGRMAFLFADPYHDTWCSHNGTIIFWQRHITDRLVLPSCPTTLRYGPQLLVAVGLITGHILMILNGEIISTKEAHSLSVTSFEWIFPLQQLISVSLDGHIIIFTLKTTSLEKKHSKLVTVADLPRSIRKTNTSTKYTGLTSLCVAKDCAFVGGEAGAVWIATFPDLILSLFHFEIDCIETLAYISSYTVVITSSGKGAVLSRNGTTVRVLDAYIYSACVTSSNLVIAGDFEQLLALQLDDLRELMKHKLAHRAFAVVPDDNALVVVDKEMLGTLYRINFNQS